MGDYALVSLDPTAPAERALPVDTKSRGRKHGRLFRWFFRFLKECWLEALLDVRTTGWKRFGFWLFALIWIHCLLFTLLVFTITSTSPSYNRGACNPDGTFSLYPYRYSLWSTPSFFQINLGGGHFSFPVAKTIDISWDIGVGRIGQAIFAIISWRTFATYLTATMEVAPVTFRTFTTIFMGTDPNGIAMFRLIRDFSTRRGLPSRLAMVFMVFSMGFILVFPTAAGAMTGYQQNTKAFIRVENGQLLPFSAFNPIAFIIHDGDRVNLTKDYHVPSDSPSERHLDYVDPVLEAWAWYHHLCLWYAEDDEVMAYSPECAQIANTTMYVKGLLQQGYGSPSGVNASWNSEFMNQTLPSPPLNITVTYWGDTYGPWDGSIPHTPQEDMLWGKPDAEDETYNVNDLLENGTCQPVETYRWGFSYLQLLLMTILVLIWSIGTYTMWLTAHLTLKDRGRSSRDVVGEFKAAVQLAAALHQELKEDPLTLSEKEIRSRIKTQLNGGEIAYDSVQPAYATPHPHQHRPIQLTHRFWNWIKRNKRWSTCLLLFLANDVGSIIYYAYLSFWAGFLFMGTVLAVTHGTTRKSRVMIAVCLSLVGGFLDMIIFVPVMYTGRYYYYMGRMYSKSEWEADYYYR